MIEKMYGAGVFYEEAANICMPEAYDQAATESGLEIVSRPEVDVTQIEKGKDFTHQSELEKYKQLHGIDASVRIKPKSISINANCRGESWRQAKYSNRC